MKRETWKTVIKIALSLLTAIAASLGLTSCNQEEFIGSVSTDAVLLVDETTDEGRWKT